MRVKVVKKGLGWSDPGWSLLVVGLVAWAAVVFLRPVLALLPRCPFHAITGLPCPTCGVTRAALALARGDVSAALGLQPLFVLAGCAALGVILRAICATATGNYIKVEMVPNEHVWVRHALPGMIALNWLYLLLMGC